MIWHMPLFYVLFIVQKCVHVGYNLCTLQSAKHILLALEAEQKASQ